jgi:hypothetical protein
MLTKMALSMRLLTLGPAIVLFGAPAASATVIPGPFITIGSTIGAAGAQVTVPISLTKNGANIVTIAPLAYTFDPNVLTFGGCLKAPGVSSGKAVNAAMPSAGRITVVVSGDLVVLPDGDIVDCSFTIAAGAAAGSVAVTFESAAMADDQFNDYDATGTSGAVTVGDGTLTPTPTIEPNPSPTFSPERSQTPSPTSTATPTDTETPAVTATTTPTVAVVLTPTRTPASCLGDCNGDKQVTVNELITMVNIALGTAQLPTCSAGDTNGDATITVNEIIGAVNNALNSCPGGQ